MTIKEQIDTLKKNWILVVLVLVFIMFSSGFGNLTSNFISTKMTDGISYDGGYARVGGVESAYYYPEVSGDFAPEIEERKITKTASLSSEVERGEFREEENRLKNIITSSGAYLLNENSNREGEGWRGYYYGYYTIKINSAKYDAFVSQLKEIGEVQSFSESMDDVTERYDDLEVELEVERARLSRYLEIYEDVEDVSEKIDLNDRIFNQERRIKYIEESLENVGARVDYSTINFRMTEEKSTWDNIAIIKISSLFRQFVNNLNNLLSFLFGALPWIVIAGIVWIIWKRFRK